MKRKHKFTAVAKCLCGCGGSITHWVIVPLDMAKIKAKNSRAFLGDAAKAAASKLQRKLGEGRKMEVIAVLRGHHRDVQWDVRLRASPDLTPPAIERVALCNDSR